jgi:hypothetical protein
MKSVTLNPKQGKQKLNLKKRSISMLTKKQLDLIYGGNQNLNTNDPTIIDNSLGIIDNGTACTTVAPPSSNTI